MLIFGFWHSLATLTIPPAMEGMTARFCLPATTIPETSVSGILITLCLQLPHQNPKIKHEYVRFRVLATATVPPTLKQGCHDLDTLQDMTMQAGGAGTNNGDGLSYPSPTKVHFFFHLIHIFNTPLPLPWHIEKHKRLALVGVFFMFWGHPSPCMTWQDNSEGVRHDNRLRTRWFIVFFIYYMCFTTNNPPFLPPLFPSEAISPWLDTATTVTVHPSPSPLTHRKPSKGLLMCHCVRTCQNTSKHERDACVGMSFVFEGPLPTWMMETCPICATGMGFGQVPQTKPVPVHTHCQTHTRGDLHRFANPCYFNSMMMALLICTVYSDCSSYWIMIHESINHELLNPHNKKLLSIKISKYLKIWIKVM